MGGSVVIEEFCSGMLSAHKGKPAELLHLVKLCRSTLVSVRDVLSALNPISEMISQVREQVSETRSPVQDPQTAEVEIAPVQSPNAPEWYDVEQRQLLVSEDSERSELSNRQVTSTSWAEASIYPSC